LVESLLTSSVLRPRHRLPHDLSHLRRLAEPRLECLIDITPEPSRAASVNSARESDQSDRANPRKSPTVILPFSSRSVNGGVSSNSTLLGCKLPIKKAFLEL
jgi:hypothetical protein